MKTELEQLKEQLNSISEQIKQLETPSFEKGWYKTKSGSIICITSIDNKKVYGYGFVGKSQGWNENIEGQKTYPFCHFYDIDRLATDKEVEEALIKQFYKVNGKRDSYKVKSLDTGDIFEFKDNKFEFESRRNTLWIKYNCGILEVFRNGIWAEIIKEEPLKICGYEVKKEGDDVYKIGCKKICKSELNIFKRIMDYNKFTEIQFDNYGKITIDQINKILEL